MHSTARIKNNIDPLEPPSHQPLVSVIIPTYNYGSFISESIKSVINQTHDNIEIIVVDDGSTDNTKSVIEEFGRKVKYVFQENSGPSAARNTGIALSHGEYILFLDADDLLGPTSVEKKARALSSNPKAAMVCGPNRVFQDKTDSLPTLVSNIYDGWWLPSAQELDVAIFHKNIAPPLAFLINRRQVPDDCLLWNESMRFCEDYDYWFKLFLHAGPPITDDSIVFYRRHNSSASKNSANMFLGDAGMIIKIYKSMNHPRIKESEREHLYFQALLAAALRCHDRLSVQELPQDQSRLETYIVEIASGYLESHSGRKPRTDIYLAILRIFLLKAEARGFFHEVNEIKAVSQKTNGNSFLSIVQFCEPTGKSKMARNTIALMYWDFCYFYLKAARIIRRTRLWQFLAK